MVDRNKIYRRIKEMGFSPKTIIDVGACYGEWSGIIKSIFTDSIIMGIDANDWGGNKHFNNCDISEIHVLTDNDDDDITFYKKIEGNCTGDSIFKENTFHYSDNLLIKEQRITKTLKTLCEKHEIKKIDLIKLDTQGSEILILKGLGERLKHVDFIEIECSLVEWNIGGCLIYDVIDFLKNDFIICDFLEQHRLNNIDLFQIDILFKNKKSNITFPLS